MAGRSGSASASLATSTPTGVSSLMSPAWRSWSRSQSPLLHEFQITFVGARAGAENIVSQREHDVEVLVQVSVMQAVMSRQKLVDRPGAEDPLLRLVHLEMNLVPGPVMKGHDGH